MHISIVDDYSSTRLEEMDPSPHFTIAPDMMEAEMRILCNSFAFAAEEAAAIVGSVLQTGPDAAGYHLPMKFQHLASPDLRATECRMEPFGGSNQNPFDATLLTYQKAILVVRFEVSPLDKLRMLVSEEFHRSTEFLTMPHEDLYWDAGLTEALTSAEAPGRMIHMAEWKYTMRRLPFIPSGVNSLQGYVNDASMSSTLYDFTFAAGTVLYENPDIVDHLDWFGDVRYDITLNLHYRSGGWNKFPKAGQEDLATIYKADGTPFSPYPTGAIQDLLLTT